MIAHIEEEKVETETKKVLDFKIVPMLMKKDDKVYPNGQAILSNWHYFTEGLNCVLNHNTGDSSYEKVLNEILSGQLTMFIGFVDGKYVGFLTTRLDDYLLSGKFVTIVHLYIKPGTDKSVFDMGFDYVRTKLCEPIGAKLRFFSPRNGWTKRLLDRGWKTGYQEFIFKGIKTN
jgi:hypothetical protein